MAESMAMQIKRLEKKLKAIAEKEIPKAVSKALNKVAKPLVGEVSRAVSQKEKIPTRLIKPRIIHHEAKFNRTRTYIKSFTRGINAVRMLSDSAVSKNIGRGTSKKGVLVRGRFIQGGFINRVERNGNVFVFERRYKRPTGGRWKDIRYPIDVLRIPIDEALLSVQLPLARDRFKANFEKFYLHELNYRLSKYAK